ncbi:hypothetical protein ACRALDRAFT_1075535 [Sodiomyces alcalophilus JCM 7366]|uniref:uncharacterized protein n=1 Tax=Sodiomyces alcalophilus JCM 7366 TaxID=591952 RepID=UPI0039B4C2E4
MAGATPVILAVLVSVVATLLKLPLIGDLHSSPIDKPLLNWDAWTKRNGGAVVTQKLFGIVPMVVINSSEAVTELFSKRAQWYSNRPASTSMEMITGAGPGKSRFTLMHDYDQDLRLHHRILSPSLGAIAAPRYQPLFELETKQLLSDLLATLKKTQDQVVSTKTVYPPLERAQSSVIVGLHYGLRIEKHEDETLHRIIDTQVKVTEFAANPGLPDFIPPLRHLPAFLSPWKRFADKFFAEQVELYMKLFNHGKSCGGWNATKQAIATAKKHAGPGGVDDLDLAFTLATSIQGGMETSPRQILWLFTAMLHNPEFVRKAHAVLDQVVGRDRLPTYADRSKLLLIDAAAHELLRWRPISPGSIPRRADKEDEYKGQRIAKGATLIANAWGIGRDEAVFDPALGNVQEYIPERWIADDGKGQARLRTDLPLAVFGQGRRICQGKRVAVDGTFMQVANLLWAFDVEAVDEVDVWSMEVIGLMTMPKEFKFKLKPRGPWVADVVEREWANADKDLGVVMGSFNDVEG